MKAAVVSSSGLEETVWCHHTIIALMFINNPKTNHMTGQTMLWNTECPFPVWVQGHQKLIKPVLLATSPKEIAFLFAKGDLIWKESSSEAWNHTVAHRDQRSSKIVIHHVLTFGLNFTFIKINRKTWHQLQSYLLFSLVLSLTKEQNKIIIEITKICTYRVYSSSVWLFPLLFLLIF